MHPIALPVEVYYEIQITFRFRDVHITHQSILSMRIQRLFGFNTDIVSPYTIKGFTEYFNLSRIFLSSDVFSSAQRTKCSSFVRVEGAAIRRSPRTIACVRDATRSVTAEYRTGSSF